MPVYHKRQVRPNIRGELYHGPIDGVRPQDHWETYYDLQRLRCSVVRIGPVFENVINNQMRFCSICYFRYRRGNVTQQFEQIMPHCLIHERIINQSRRCYGCDELIITITPAYQCLLCVEEFLNIDRLALNSSFKIRVIQRWLEWLAFE